MSEQPIKFTRKHPWSCPSFRDFYIKDRANGKDIHGKTIYEYALFRKYQFQVVKRFRTRKQAYLYVSNITGINQYRTKTDNFQVIFNDRDYLGVSSDNGTCQIIYRITKRTNEVAILRNVQISGWYDKYIWCLNEAKKLIAMIQEKENLQEVIPI